MSRVAKKPINLPKGVECQVKADAITVKGPKGTLAMAAPAGVDVAIDGGQIKLSAKNAGSMKMAGTARALINNMVIGVSKGYEIKQELVGVGFKAEVKGQVLEMSLGYSHDTYLMLPPEVTATAVTEKKGNPIVTLKSMDKQLIGQVAAKIRSLRKPEPYKGKGIKFVGEQLRRKAGKSAGAK